MSAVNPTIHALYAPVLDDQVRPDPLPPPVRARVANLLRMRNEWHDTTIESIDAQIVAEMLPYVVHPDEIASRIMRDLGWRSPLTPPRAVYILAAISECGYDITGNGAPSDPQGAARYWVERAREPFTYVSLSDSRGWCPRLVQHDAPGSMNPMQLASLTFGPILDRGHETNPHAYMRTHTRRLILVR